MKISKYFSTEELECKCGCSACYIHKNQLIALDRLRSLLNSPLHTTSGFRCIDHNEDVGGSKTSWHLFGRATDIYSAEYTPDEIAEVAKDLFNEVIPYADNGFCHVGDPKEF